MRNPDAYYEGADESELYDRDGMFSDMERFERSEELSKAQEDALLAMSEEDDELLSLLDDEEVPSEIAEDFED